MKSFNLKGIFKNYSNYRIKQLKRAIFVNLIEDWSLCTSLPKEVREDLNNRYPLKIKAREVYSKDKRTIKLLLTLDDGLKIESVLMRYKDGRNSVCVSTQVGCPLGCKFCATGKIGFKRNLEWNEIIEQVIYFARLLKKEKGKITNIVFMGMGEPFLNYENVKKSIQILNYKDGFNLGMRRFSISTVGIPKMILKLAEDLPQVNLAISLHAPNDKLRSKLMPINKKYPISIVLKAVDQYIEITNRRVMFEYIMINNVNDKEENAYELAELLKNKLCFINLIPCNKVNDYIPSTKEAVNQFKAILTKNNITVIQRYSFGQDIEAACGQLVGKS
jgi:23S rRNA (adenine2503-C2)-methyltransferase